MDSLPRLVLEASPVCRIRSRRWILRVEALRYPKPTPHVRHLTKCLIAPNELTSSSRDRIPPITTPLARNRFRSSVTRYTLVTHGGPSPVPLSCSKGECLWRSATNGTAGLEYTSTMSVRIRRKREIDARRRRGSMETHLAAQPPLLRCSRSRPILPMVLHLPVWNCAHSLCPSRQSRESTSSTPPQLTRTLFESLYGSPRKSWIGRRGLQGGSVSLTGMIGGLPRKNLNS